MTEKKGTYYITTPIYYPSSNLHIGHILAKHDHRVYQCSMDYYVNLDNGTQPKYHYPSSVLLTLYALPNYCTLNRTCERCLWRNRG